MAKNLPRTVTPMGVARFPWLNRADDKFYDLGEYKCDLIVGKEDAAQFVENYTSFLNAEAKKSKAKATHSSIVDETDDQGNLTGNVIIKTKNRNKMVNGELWDRKPALFDGNGEPLTAEVGGGSTVKLAVEFFPACVNGKQFCTVQIRGVKVYDLVEYGASMDFGDEEDAATVQDVDTPDKDDDLF